MITKVNQFDKRKYQSPEMSSWEMTMESQLICTSGFTDSGIISPPSVQSSNLQVSGTSAFTRQESSSRSISKTGLDYSDDDIQSLLND